MKLQFLVRKRILVISPEPWDHIPVSKHHYSMELANLGNEIYFLNPPSHQNNIAAAPDNKNIKIINYNGISGLNQIPAKLRFFLNRMLLRRIFKLSSGEFDVVWTFDPFRFQDLNLFKTSAKIYHAVDIHISPLEEQLANSCHVILSVSDMILERFNHLNKPRVKINHGLASHFLSEIRTEYITIQSKRRQVGYVGNLDNWCLDKITLLTIVNSHPEVDFNFIGPFKSDSELGSNLKKSTNARLIGKVASSALPEYLNKCDIFLMCYDGSNQKVNSNHHKIIEYLATGKPVVMNFTDEYKDKRDLVIMSDDNRELPLLFNQVIHRLEDFNGIEVRAKRIAFAESNSYFNHVIHIDDILAKIISNVPVAHQATQ
ncbi:MAG: glycosyltransferase [Cyclobacteriaceae bacterium]